MCSISASTHRNALARSSAVFGFWNGLLVSVIGAMASACLAFGIARLVGREAARRLVPANGLAWVDRTVTQGGWRAVLLIQFIPLLPYSLPNFALGLTLVSWVTFLWVTVVSILPQDIVLVALGHGVAEARAVLYWTIAALIVLTSFTILAPASVGPGAEDSHEIGWRPISYRESADEGCSRLVMLWRFREVVA